VISLLSLMLICSPALTPELIPAHTIYMGDHIAPIVANREKCGSLTGFCMTLTLSQFLRVRDVVHNSPRLCDQAVELTAQTCVTRAAQVAELASKRTTDDAKIIESYQLKLDALDLARAKNDLRAQRWKWGAVSAGSVALILTSIIILRN
jgi:hypothetical protein